MTTTVARWLICLCVLASLASCGPVRESQAIRRPVVVEVPVTDYAPLPASLTDRIVPPPAPPARCRLRDGTPAVCVLDALATIPAYQGALETCNADRAKAALIGAADGE